MNAKKPTGEGRSTTCFKVTFLAAALVAISTNAQEVSSVESTSTGPNDEYSSKESLPKDPLRPADTSSPRDTLRSFLADMDIVLDDVQRNGFLITMAGYRDYERALSTLDFSTTPNGNSRMTMNRRILLLMEILNRIELPPYGEIPGDDEVALGALNEWTIPDSRITIKRIENGP